MGREEVEFDSGDERCAAWLFRPADAAQPAPCVVMASGLSCVREQRLDAFARSLDGVDRERISLWGFSLGGGHVQAVAISEPGIAAVVCVAPVIDGVRTLLHIGGPAHLGRVAGAGLRDAVGAALGRGPHLVPAGGPPGSGAVLARPNALAEFEATTPPGSSWRNELCARAALRPPYRLERKVRRISCPTFYCIADDDEINPPALGIAAAGRPPRGELRRYPGGHFAPLLPDAFESVVADQIEFLRRTLARS